MDGDPFAHLDASRALIPEHARVVEISREQYRAHAQPGAGTLWQGPTRCAAGVFGGAGWLAATLSVTEDGMVYSRGAEDGLLLWCASARPPNACRLERGAFWVSKIDSQERDAKFGRIHPLMAYFNDPGRVAVPYLGAWAIYRGHRGTKELRAVLRSLGAGLG